MDPKLERKHQALQQQWEHLFARMQGLDDEQLNHPPQPQKWSVVQVLYHLIQSDKLVIAYIKKKIVSEQKLAKTGFRTWFRTVLLQIALRGPFKFKAPPMVAEVPDFMTLAEIQSAWRQSNQNFHALLASFPPHLMGKEIFRHPYAGRLNLYQTLDFMADHFSHHLKQVNPILKRRASGTEKTTT
jgi:uncharacterized damage-inducible protein DinB